MVFEKLQAVRPLLCCACCVPIVVIAVVLTGGQSEQGKTGFRLKNTDAPSAAFSPDSKYIVTGGFRKISLLDVNTHSLVDRFPEEKSGNFGTRAYDVIAVSPDGTHVASAGGVRPTMAVRVWSFHTGHLECSFDTHCTDIWALAFSPDGRWLAAGTGFRRHQGAKPYEGVYEIWMWDITRESEPVAFRGHEAPVQAIQFFPDGKRIVSASNDWTLRIWDVATQRALKQSWTPRVFGPPFGFPAAGARFGGFDSGAGEWLKVARLNRISLTLSADGKHLVCGRSVWDANKLELEYFVDGGRLWTDFDQWQSARGRGPVASSEAFGMVATNSVGGVLTDEGRRLVYSDNGTIYIFDVGAKKVLREYQVFRNGAAVFALDVSPDGHYALAAGSGGTAGPGGAGVGSDPCQLYVYHLPPPSSTLAAPHPDRH